jgi:phage gp29-like protein
MDLARLNPFRGVKPWGQFKAPKIVQGKAPLQEVAPALGYTSLVGLLAPISLAGDLPPGAQGYTTYRRMQHDPQVKACLSTKKFAVLSRGWEIHPASDSAADVAVADFCRWTVQDMKGSVLDALYSVLDALALGVSVLEINYKLLEDGPHAGKIGLQSLKAKNPEIFFFDVDSFMNLHALRIAGGELLDPQKFLIYSYQPQYENPLGTSDLRAAYQSWFIKNQVLGWWAKFLEKFGLPTVTGSYDPKAGYSQKQIQDLMRTLQQVHNETAIALPADMEIKLLEAQRSLDAGFDEAISYLDRGIAKSILGETLTADSSAKGSTYALGQVHMDVLSFYLQKLQRDLEETVMTEQLLQRLVAYNFPAGTACPTFSLGKIDDGKLQTAGTLIAQLITGGVVAPGEPWIRNYLGIPAEGAESAM